MDVGCKICKNELCASKVPIFSTLSTEELKEIVIMIVRRNYSRGETIFLEGMKSNKLFIINEGRIKIFKYTKDGKEQILHILSEGEFFGELNLLREGTYNFNALAIEDVKLCTLSKDNMRRLLLQRPEIGLKILEVVGERLSRLENLAQNLATNDAQTRIAHLLLELAQNNGHITDKGIEINLTITREDMSNFTGLTRETISRKLSKFQDEGIIELIGSKKIVILDEEKLRDYLC